MRHYRARDITKPKCVNENCYNTQAMGKEQLCMMCYDIKHKVHIYPRRRK